MRTTAVEVVRAGMPVAPRTGRRNGVMGSRDRAKPDVGASALAQSVRRRVFCVLSIRLGGVAN
jgi:hypothetical protein